ncbi:PDZ domain-containing protein, partial [Planctomicrobium sp.]
RVLDATPAASAGLQRDDVIISFDGVDIEDENDLINRVSLTPVNKEVRMIVVRNGRKIALSVNLAERERLQSSLPTKQIAPDKPSLFKNSSLVTHQLTPELSQQLGLESTQTGLIVMQVPDSSDENGLQLYDIIEEVGRTKVQTPEEFSRRLTQIGNDSAIVKVSRVIQGKTVSRLVILNQ